MPVFFFIDPDFCNDPTMNKIDTITLSYTFFSKFYSNLISESSKGILLEPFADVFM